MSLQKIIIVMKEDITIYPPIMSLCYILSELRYKVVYIGACSSDVTKKELGDLEIKSYIQPIYNGNALVRLKQQLSFRHNVKKIIKSEYDENSTLWIVNYETLILFSSLLDSYKFVAHLLEFRDVKLSIGYRLLAPFFSYKKKLKYAKKVICCEYNRAQITKYLFQLKEIPVVLPNKLYTNNIIKENLPEDVLNIISKYQNRKIILYQGAFQPERKLDDFILAMDLLPKDYVLFLMGPINKYNKALREKYVKDNVVFVPFIPSPLHLCITKLAYIGILSYIPQPNNIGTVINALYCAPNKIYEYSRFSIPMIANEVPALKYAFLESRAGICVENLAPEYIRDSILYIDEKYQDFSRDSKLLYDRIDLKKIVESVLNSIT